ncbi:cation-translocating P-type ATPase [Sanguibacter sp. 25GB23B1]|uniref:heavy metal translocating P-type ATPase n=1 Tax=unclassified Sanguibacter TaxID=2645534 RepID=UPI0032AF88F6
MSPSSSVRAVVRSPWAVPAVAGALIVAAFAVGRTASTTVSDVLMVVAAGVAGAPIVAHALRALTVRVVGIDLLVSVAAIGAVVIGEQWEAAAVTFLFAVGHALEAATLTRTRAALTHLVEVAPSVAIVVRDGEQVEVPASSVLVGETVLVKNGAKVPVDGEVLGGVGALDEASITGESMPVEKVPGDRVFAGTVATSGFLQVLAQGVGADTTLARIIRRVEEAQDAKARTQLFIDRFSAWYTPAIMVLALAAGLMTGDVVVALTLLVIGCPGALVISIPVSIVAGIGRAAKDGILIKGGEFLEASARVTAVAVDKTGTLTRGRPRVTDVRVLDPALSTTDLLRWAARAEAGSEHPLARPIISAAKDAGISALGVPEETESVPGMGIAATVDGHRVLVGSYALLERSGIRSPEARDVASAFASAGRTPMLVALDDRAVGVVAVADEVRTDAAHMVARLRAAGVRTVVMLTGDAEPVARAVAVAVGVDDVRAGLLPEDKLAAVRSLQRDGHTVAMVGDGVNDAPALAAADIGIAMGAAGSAVAIETADIALMADDLLKLPEAIALARRTVRTMRQNIAVALMTVSLLVAGVLLGGVTMAVGMLVHEVSVLVVIANAMRLLRASGRDERHAVGHASAVEGRERVAV